MKKRGPCILPVLFLLAPVWIEPLLMAGEPRDDELNQLQAEVGSLRAIVERLQKTVADQQRVIEDLSSRTPRVGEPAQAQAPTPGPEGVPQIAQAPLPPPVPPGGGSTPTANYFNPAISVIGNFLGVGGHNPVESLPSAEVRESEVGLQAILDPYGRADFFLSFAEEGVDLEEGFVTFTTLPGAFLAKVGRMRASFGKTNPLHLHVLPWADEPLPVVNLLGGEEGWIGTGVSVARIIPLPGDLFSEATVEIFRGNAEGLFEAPSRGDLAYNARYRLFEDLTESTNLDLGFSYGVGPNGVSSDSQTRLQGIDATIRFKPLRTASYRGASFRGEFIRSRREEIAGSHPSGWFVSGEYRLARRWFAGARVEAADHPDDSSARDRGQAVLLTFWPSEFSQLRGELRRRLFAGGPTATELLLQVQFAIGTHGAHPF